MKKLSFLLLLAVGMIWQMDAQIETPALSPLSTIEQTVGLSDVKIEYSRPSMRGRTIFGGLVAYGEMWRTGANASTKVTFSDDVMIQGNKLEGGTYALYTIPGEDEWTVIFHKNLTHWGVGGDNYNPDEDALRVMIEPYKMENTTVETFTMGVGDIDANGAHIYVLWEQVYLPIEFELNTREQVQASIDAALSGPTGRDYYAAAQYYYTEKIDHAKALGWIDMAIENEYNGFWVLKLKSEIQADMGNHSAAIKTAKMSKEAAMEAGNMNYVRMNEENIKKWSM